MNFAFSDSQKEYREKVLSFVKALPLDGISELDEKAQFNRKAWLQCGEFGIQGGPVPREFGGAGLDLPTYLAGMEVLGNVYPDAGLMFAIGAHVFACEMPLLAFGSNEQKERWLPELCSGRKIAAIAISEEQSASDAFRLLTTASKEDDGYVLNGTKRYVTNAPFCDVAMVFAACGQGDDSIICLLIENGAPGMRRIEAAPKMGFRTAPFGSLVFEDCRVPETNVLGKPSSGRMIFMTAMEWERGCLLAPMVGIMQRQVDACVLRAKARSQGGRNLSDHQAVSHRIVDMKMRTELARLMLFRFAWQKQTKRRAGMEASMAKLYISEAFLANSLDAVQLHGAFGYTCEAGFEKDLRDAVGTRIASGTSDIQRNIIAKWLKL